MDVATVLNSVHRDRLSLELGGARYPLPVWANWLIWLGLWMRCQVAMDGRRVVVVRLPTRRLSAAFVGLGALFAASRLHDDALDWGTLQALPMGTKVHWRQKVGNKSSGYIGRTDSPREFQGKTYLAISVEWPKRSKGSTFLLPKATALSYGVTLGTVTLQTEERLSAAAGLFRNVVDQASLSWIRSPAIDSTLVTERSSFVADLEGLSFGTEGFYSIPALDALATSDATSRKHGKLQVVPPRTEAMSDAEGLTVLDGPAAAMQLGNSHARSVILLLEHAEYDEEVLHLLNPFVGHSIESGVHVPTDGLVPVPAGMEAFAFGLPVRAVGGDGA